MMDLTVKGTWTSMELDRHINWREMMGAWRVIQAFQSHLQGHRVMLRVDNTTVVAYPNHQGGDQIGLPICSRRGNDSLDSFPRNGPDSGTSGRSPEQYSRRSVALPSGGQQLMGATQWLANQLFRLWPSPTVDLFATPTNTKCPWFMTRRPTPTALAWSALEQNWEMMDAYTFPPFAQLDKMLQKIKESPNCRVTLIALNWPINAWFPLLLALTVSRPAIPVIHLEVIQQLHRARGFSKRVSDKLRATQRWNTLSVYQSKWGFFLTWCIERKINPVKATLPQLTEILTDR